MKKGIAVPYIIAIILGVLVIGIIGYWFFVLYGGGVGKSSEAVCNSKKQTFCSAWAATAYQTEPSGDWESYAPDCIGVVSRPTIPECRVLLTTAKPSGASCSVDSECQSGSCPECPLSITSCPSDTPPWSWRKDCTGNTCRSICERTIPGNPPESMIVATCYKTCR
jgi:hypothetical protein